jgi:signal transduction histidine kinase
VSAAAGNGRPTLPAPPDAGAEQALALANLPDAVVVLDEGGQVTYANPAAGGLLGIATGHLLGRPFQAVADLRDVAGNAWWPCTAKLRAMRAVRGVPPRELLLAGPEGSPERRIDLSAAFVRGADGQVQRTVCTLREAAARRRADAAQAELVSTLAHELRSPLTSVKGFSSTLLHRWDRFGDEQKQHMLKTINADADRVTRLIRELLDVSRIDAGRLELQRQMVDLPYLVGGIAERFSVTDTAVAIESQFPPGFPELYADRDKLEQVLTNLVENAVKHGDGGKVTITGTVGDDHVEVGVLDTGDGIPADQLPLIFTKFFSSRHPGGRRGSAGTGLGLFISKGIVEAHGGRMWAESEPGRGTEVRFRLPRGGLELAGID